MRAWLSGLPAALAFSVALAQAPGPAKPDAVTPDGASYYGALRDGKLHGRGKLAWANGTVYEGEFAHGLMSGRGEIAYADGRRYRGEFERGSFHGRGRFESPDGEVHEGRFHKHEFSGRGTLSRRDGSRYEGEFVNWRFHGQGRFTDSGGNLYEGTFVNGEFEGRGQLSGPSGNRYEGEFKQWRFHGHGVLRFANGDVYRGGFANGLYEGEGTYTYAKPRPDGRTQQAGTWRSGQFQDPKAEQQASLNVERALYSQGPLLERTLAALKPSDPERVNLYLLAVAGDGSQEVFRREVDFVARDFAERFGTAGRTVALINSRNTVETAPMATATSIRRALAAIAGRMNREQDILFVFLTSHGSRDNELVLDQAGMGIADLPAAELGRLLRESGIRWRVVVVSACYSGGFIDSLKDEHALVITAARRDRASFGCADEHEFTHFGRAYFKDALPRASSFEDAFRRAEVLVREMEMREGNAGDKHSLPQMSSAPPIERQLRRLWTQISPR